MISETQHIFLSLVRLGIGQVNEAKLTSDNTKPIDWIAVKALADEQGLTAVVLDGVNEVLTSNSKLSSLNYQLKLSWIGEVQHWENVFAAQQKAAEEMAELFHENHIRTYVLKGLVVSECYPNPKHRLCADLDCYLSMTDENGIPITDSHEDAWSLANSLIEARWGRVDTIHYKNSTFHLPGLMVENHQYITPFRGNRTLEMLEIVLQAMMNEEKAGNRFEGTWLYRPPVMVSALFLIEHAYSHFLHEGLTWRMVLDWQMYSRKHKAEIDWTALEVWIDEFGFRKFYESFLNLGRYLLGDAGEDSLSKAERMMLADIWAPLDLHETALGVKGKLALAGNTWRARWKYRHFTNMSWITALCIQAYGFLFLKKPKLD